MWPVDERRDEERLGARGGLGSVELARENRDALVPSACLPIAAPAVLGRLRLCSVAALLNRNHVHVEAFQCFPVVRDVLLAVPGCDPHDRVKTARRPVDGDLWHRQPLAEPR